MLASLASILLPCCHGIFLLSPGTFYWKKPTPKPRSVPRILHRVHSQPREASVTSPQAAIFSTSSGDLYGKDSRILPPEERHEAAESAVMTRPRTKTYEGSTGIPKQRCCPGSPSKTWRKLFDAPLQVFSDRASKKILKGKRLLGLRKELGKTFMRKAPRASRQDNGYPSTSSRENVLLMEENKLIKTLKSAWESVKKVKEKPAKSWTSFDPWHGRRRKRSVGAQTLEHPKISFRFNPKRVGYEGVPESKYHLSKKHFSKGQNYDKVTKLNVVSKYLHDKKQKKVFDAEEVEFEDDQFLNHTDYNEEHTNTLLDTVFYNSTNQTLAEPQIRKLKEELIQLTGNSTHNSDDVLSKVLQMSLPLPSDTVSPKRSNDSFMEMKNKRRSSGIEFQHPDFKSELKGMNRHSGFHLSYPFGKHSAFSVLPQHSTRTFRNASQSPHAPQRRLRKGVKGKNVHPLKSISKLIYTSLAKYFRGDDKTNLNDRLNRRTKMIAYLTNINGRALDIFQNKYFSNFGSLWPYFSRKREHIIPISSKGIFIRRVNSKSTSNRTTGSEERSSQDPIRYNSTFLKSQTDKEFSSTGTVPGHRSNMRIKWKKSFFERRAFLFDEQSPLIKNCVFGCLKRPRIALDFMNKISYSLKPRSNDTVNDQTGKRPSISTIKAIERLNNDILFIDILSAIIGRVNQNFTSKVNISRPEALKVIKMWNINNLDLGPKRMGSHRFRRSTSALTNENALKKGSSKFETHQRHLYLTPTGSGGNGGLTNQDSVKGVNDLGIYFTGDRIPWRLSYLRSRNSHNHQSIEPSEIPSEEGYFIDSKAINDAGIEDKRDPELTDFDMLNKAHVEGIYSHDNIEIKDASFEKSKTKQNPYDNLLNNILSSNSVSDLRNLATSELFKKLPMGQNEGNDGNTRMHNLLNVKRRLESLRKKPTRKEMLKDSLAILNIAQDLIKKYREKSIPKIGLFDSNKNLKVKEKGQLPFNFKMFNTFFMKRASTIANIKLGQKRNIINPQKAELETDSLLTYLENEINKILNMRNFRADSLGDIYGHSSEENINVDQDDRRLRNIQDKREIRTSNANILLNQNRADLLPEISPEIVSDRRDESGKQYLESAPVKRLEAPKSTPARHKLYPFRLIDGMIYDKPGTKEVHQREEMATEMQLPASGTHAFERETTLNSLMGPENFEFPSSPNDIVSNYHDRLSQLLHSKNNLKPNIIPRVPFQEPSAFPSQKELNIPYMTSSPDVIVPSFNQGFSGKDEYIKPVQYYPNTQYQIRDNDFFNNNGFENIDNDLSRKDTLLSRPSDDEEVTLTYFLPISSHSKNRNTEPSEEERNFLTALSIVRPIGFSQFVK